MININNSEYLKLLGKTLQGESYRAPPTNPEFPFQISKSSRVLRPVSFKIYGAILSSLKHLNRPQNISRQIFVSFHVELEEVSWAARETCIRPSPDGMPLISTGNRKIGNNFNWYSPADANNSEPFLQRSNGTLSASNVLQIGQYKLSMSVRSSIFWVAKQSGPETNVRT